MPVDDTYQVQGCPGGPGHPGPITAQLAEGAAQDLVQAVKDGNFNDLRPRLLTMCQCNLVEIIDILAVQAAADPHDVVA